MTEFSFPRNGTNRPVRDRAGTASRTQDFFKQKETRNKSIYQQMETERAISDAKTAKLRALRLAKEESDRAAAPEKKK